MAPGAAEQIRRCAYITNGVRGLFQQYSANGASSSFDEFRQQIDVLKADAAKYGGIPSCIAFGATSH
ncbi:uncharacterized protein RHO25_008028 [Cercospora beticola]|uniref:Uncharacterized protein n=1 Tax=Cercospora beticola TaxID=122368 RepID=A0ABZ0NV07_CERBT|nr:hypothetical protein RHO25_008028 [Cercospora beticola]